MDYKFLVNVCFIQNKAPATAAALEKKLKVHSVVLQGLHSMANVLYTVTVRRRDSSEAFKLSILLPKQVHIPKHVPLLIQN